MKKKRVWKGVAILICLIALISSFLSCATPLVAAWPPANQQPPWPSLPIEVPVIFEGVPDGLFLAAEEYRNLERNVIELRRYIRELEVQLHYYRGDSLD